jgi:hypothetical protein
LESDSGEHYRFMVENRAVANIIYSTQETPVDLNDDKDVKMAHEKEVHIMSISQIEREFEQKLKQR